MDLDDFNLDSPDETMPEDLAKARGDLVEVEDDDETIAPAKPAKPAVKAEPLLQRKMILTMEHLKQTRVIRKQKVKKPRKSV